MVHVHLQILVITHTCTPTWRPKKVHQQQLFLPAYLLIRGFRALLVFTTVMSRQVSAAQEVTTFSRGLVTGCGGSVPLCLKTTVSIAPLKVAPQISSTDKILNRKRCWSWSRKKLTPLRSALFLTGDGSALLRHHIATTERKLTRKEIRIIYMWTGF